MASSVMQEGIDVAAVTKHLRFCSPVLHADGHRATLHVQLLWMVYLGSMPWKSVSQLTSLIYKSFTNVSFTSPGKNLV